MEYSFIYRASVGRPHVKGGMLFNAVFTAESGTTKLVDLIDDVLLSVDVEESVL